MRYLIFILLISFACKTQSIENKNLNDSAITKTQIMSIIPTVNSKQEHFDFDKVRAGYLKMMKDKGEILNPEVLEETYRYEQQIENEITSVKIFSEIRGKDGNLSVIGSPIETIYYKNSPFELRKIFYANGNVKQKGLSIISGNVYKGNWYYFDENAKLTHTVNNDIAYNFKWEDIQKFMEKNKIPLLLNYNDKNNGTEINRSSPLIFPETSVFDVSLLSKKAMWSVKWKGSEWNQYWEVVFDGDSGRMLSRKKYWISEGGESVPETVVEKF